MSTLPRTRGQRRGGVLIIALLFIAMFSSLAAAVAAFSGVNVHLGDNLRKADNTRACAESGLEVTRYWLNKVAFSGMTATGDRLAATAARLQTLLGAAGITNLVPVCDGTTITIADVALNSSRQQSFSAVLRQIDADRMRVEVTGHNGSVSRTLVSNFVFDERTHTVFDYGVATKGPLELSGNAEVLGTDIEVNAFIDTNDWNAVTLMGKSHIAGTVNVTGSDATTLVHVGGNASIGEVSGPAAAQPPSTNYETPTTEFPEMDPSYFYHYATNLLDPATSTSGHLTLENIRIPAGMNPDFSGGVTIRGVVYIEAPNVVTFGGSTVVCGVIVGAGSPTDYSGTNSITFTGSLTSYAMDDPNHGLPQEPQFADLRNETGTFLMAPGFRAEFQGPFETVSGAVAANGITFSGTSGGTIDGSLINYSPTLMTCGGTNDLVINRTDANVLRPAGFKPQTIVRYDPSSYSEVL